MAKYEQLLAEYKMHFNDEIFLCENQAAVVEVLTKNAGYEAVLKSFLHAPEVHGDYPLYIILDEFYLGKFMQSLSYQELEAKIKHGKSS